MCLNAIAQLQLSREELRIKQKVLLVSRTAFVLSKAIKPDLTIDKASDLDEQEIEKIKKKYGIDRNIEEER